MPRTDVRLVSRQGSAQGAAEMAIGVGPMGLTPITRMFGSARTSWSTAIAKGYWIAHITITEPDTYKQYAATNQAAIKQFGGRFIVRGGKASPGFPNQSRFEIMHGTLRDGHVVLEFDSYELALACCNSPEYQAAATIRDRGGHVDVMVIEGFEA